MKTQPYGNKRSRPSDRGSWANEVFVFRVVSLPVEINPEKSIATLQGGILNVTLPKAAAKPVRVEVKTGVAA